MGRRDARDPVTGLPWMCKNRGHELELSRSWMSKLDLDQHAYGPSLTGQPRIKLGIAASQTGMSDSGRTFAAP